MSYIRHKIVLTLPRTDPTLFVEQGFAGRCESAGTVGQRVLHGGSSRQGTLGHGSHALRSIPPGTPFRFRLTPIGQSIRAPLPAPRLATSSAVSYGRVAVRPSEIIASFQIIPHAFRSKRRIHGMTVTPLEHSCDANPSTNAQRHVAPRSAIRTRHGRHVFINALRNAHKMAFFPSVPRTVQESSQWLSPQSALP
ncbi:protein of unknown function (plasmid) [Caballeronia sp. S22]